MRQLAHTHTHRLHLTTWRRYHDQQSPRPLHRPEVCWLGTSPEVTQSTASGERSQRPLQRCRMGLVRSRPTRPCAKKKDGPNTLRLNQAPSIPLAITFPCLGTILWTVWISPIWQPVSWRPTRKNITTLCARTGCFATLITHLGNYSHEAAPPAPGYHESH